MRPEWSLGGCVGIDKMKTGWKSVIVRRKDRDVQETSRRLEIKTGSDPESLVCQLRVLAWSLS